MGRPGIITPIIDKLEDGEVAEFPLTNWDAARAGAYCISRRSDKLFSVNRFGSTILVKRTK